jgi:AcrR family transcriptional regulator
VLAAAGNDRTSRQARAAQTRSRLLTAAVTIFSEKPYDEVAVSDIASKATVAHGVLFHHFQNKRGIYLEAVRQAARELDAAHERAPHAPAGEQVRHMFESHLRFLEQHRGLALNLILGGYAADQEAWNIFEQTRWHTITWVCSCLGLPQDSPALRLMLRALAGSIDQATIYWLTNDCQFTVAALAESFINLTIANIRATAQLDPTLTVESAINLLRATAP